jgi:hypothetical protein
MLPKRDSKKIYSYQLMTLGFYYLYWCARSGGEVNRALNRKTVPSAWLFIIPFANYWWGWKYAEALQELTGRHVKRDDTFLLFALPTLVFPFSFQINNIKVGSAVWILIIVLMAVSLLVVIILNALFCSQTQKHINAWVDTVSTPTT